MCSAGAWQGGSIGVSGPEPRRACLLKCLRLVRRRLRSRSSTGGAPPRVSSRCASFPLGRRASSSSSSSGSMCGKTRWRCGSEPRGWPASSRSFNSQARESGVTQGVETSLNGGTLVALIRVSALAEMEFSTRFELAEGSPYHRLTARLKEPSMGGGNVVDEEQEDKPYHFQAPGSATSCARSRRTSGSCMSRATACCPPRTTATSCSWIWPGARPRPRHLRAARRHGLGRQAALLHPRTASRRGSGSSPTTPSTRPKRAPPRRSTSSAGSGGSPARFDRSRGRQLTQIHL